MTKLYLAQIAAQIKKIKKISLNRAKLVLIIQAFANGLAELNLLAQGHLLIQANLLFRDNTRTNTQELPIVQHNGRNMVNLKVRSPFKHNFLTSNLQKVRMLH
jgi:hypothetical protein